MAISSDPIGGVMAKQTTVHYGSSLVLNCTSFGGPGIIFHWFKNGSYLEGNNNNILSITDVTADDGGLYECVVNNTAGNSSANITIYGMSCSSFNTCVSSL